MAGERLAIGSWASWNGWCSSEMAAMIAGSRRVISRLASTVVDAAGGWPERLPDGTGARVAFECRGFGRQYETEVVQAFVDAVKPGMLVVDVGAHWGVYTLLAAHRGANVIAFEPVLRNRELLERNLKMSHLAADVRATAITNIDGELTFHAYDGRSWGKSMMGGLTPQEFTRPIAVPASRLDSLDLDPDMIKLDIEGAEGLALEGAVRTIRRARPTIFVEVHLQRLADFGMDSYELQARFSDWGYERRVLLDVTGHDGERVSHWLCTPAMQRSG